MEADLNTALRFRKLGILSHHLELKRATKEKFSEGLRGPSGGASYLLNECRVREMLLCARIGSKLADKVGILEYPCHSEVCACARIPGLRVVSVAR
jgi:hypothetical protein